MSSDQNNHISPHRTAASDEDAAAAYLDFLKKKSAPYLERIAYSKGHIRDNELKQLSLEELITRLELLEDERANFEKAQWSLEKQDVNEIGSTARSTFVADYIAVKSALRKEINIRQAAEQHNSTTRPHGFDEHVASYIISPPKPRLPALQIPKFGGSYTDWPNFISMFTTIVDQDPDLTKIEKLQHLRSSLKEAALESVRSLEFNNENYDKALRILKARYDNKRLNFQAHIKEIFGLKQSDAGTATQLRELSDKFNANYQALETMAQKTEIADGILIHFITNMFDTKTKLKWEESTPTDVLPTLESVLKFWEKRCQMLESVQEAMAKEEPSTHSGKKSNSSTKKTLVAATSKACVFCEATDHVIYQCKAFAELSSSVRLKEAKKLQLCLNCLKKGHFAKSCKSSTCRKCESMHHTLLHGANQVTSNVENATAAISANTSTSLVSANVSKKSKSTANSLPSNAVLLATAVVFVKDKFGSRVPCRAVLDSASQIHFVTSRLANTLQLRKIKTTTGISGIGQSNFTSNHAIEIELHSRSEKFTTTFIAAVTPSITDNQPNYTLGNIDWKIPANIQLADPSFYKSQRIDMLIGAALFFDLLCVGQIRLSPDLPMLQKTRLGWVVCRGRMSNSSNASCLSISEGNQSEYSGETSLDQMVKAFWEVENCFSSTAMVSQEELDCQRHFVGNYNRLCTGEYAVRLPFKKDPNIIGDSYNSAMFRFKNLEKKLGRNPSLKQQYSAFISEYLHLGHMSLVSEFPTGIPRFFLPHHCVLKADSTTTKLRVVFDGSARGSSGLSLNDILMNGPTIQPKLFDTLLRFRLHSIALTGDVAKMYRCVRVSDPDAFMQCIIWRNSDNDAMQIYKLDTVTYGTKSAPFLAIRAMQQLASDERETFPLGAATVFRDFYVDDLLTGADTIDEACEIKNQTTLLLAKGNFHIRKWCTNSMSLIQTIPDADRETLLKFHDGTEITKTLGLCWNPKTDEFLFSFSSQNEIQRATKRIVLSIIARFYDPLGLLGPVITKAKIFLQHLWKEKLDWDESLPLALKENWQQIYVEFDNVPKCKFPRYVLAPSSKIQVHAFCDASQNAYGACVYTVVEEDGITKTNLLCSKSRVAPLKALTIPKLELSAALLLAQLISPIYQMNCFGHDFHCWSDSTIVLGWLNEASSNFNVFVANRVSEIQTITKNMSWRYVPTEMNPADIISRGASPTDLCTSHLWRFGPKFLSQPAHLWPLSPSQQLELPERRKRACVATFATIDYSLTSKHANSFLKLQRTYAYIYKFRTKSRGALSPADIRAGTLLLIRMIQKVCFHSEYKTLQARKNVASSSSLSSLNPFIDNAGVMRVGGRLANSNLDFDAKHPIILPKQHPVSDAIVTHFHRTMLHAGPQSLLATLRLQYWPIGGRRNIKRILNKCIICFRAKPTTFEHIMGSLPADRVQINRAFLVTGVDFCGPFYYKSEIRNKSPIKCYVCLFICFSTKAVHMEIARDLSTQSFLAALKRFIAIRGKPHTIWSDNATNFVGAKNELAELRRLFESDSHRDAVHQQCLSDCINWQFIPPRSPHFGGSWEASIKLFKYHFIRTMGQYTPAYDELNTLVCQISAVLNSRPLSPLSESPDSLDVLTPAHFLIGSPLTSIVEPNLAALNISRLDNE